MASGHAKNVANLQAAINHIKTLGAGYASKAESSENHRAGGALRGGTRRFVGGQRSAPGR